MEKLKKKGKSQRDSSEELHRVASTLKQYAEIQPRNSILNEWGLSIALECLLQTLSDTITRAPSR